MGKGPLEGNLAMKMHILYEQNPHVLSPHYKSYSITAHIQARTVTPASSATASKQRRQAALRVFQCFVPFPAGKASYTVKRFYFSLKLTKYFLLLLFI